MSVRLKLGGLILDDDKPNLEFIGGECPPAEDQVRTALIMALMNGVFMRTHDDKWKCGDHGDLDANAPKHLMQLPAAKP
jgi:hypothetical protein